MKYFIDTEFLEGTQKRPHISKAMMWIGVLFILGAFVTANFNWAHLIVNSIIGIAYIILSRQFYDTKPTIDLISIGIKAEDNREYYAISKDFNLKEAWNRYQMKQVSGDARNRYPEGVREYWIRENVLKPIFDEWKSEENGKIVRLGLPIPLYEGKFNYKNFKYCIKCIGKTKEQIAEEIKEFVYCDGDTSMHRKFTYSHLVNNKSHPQFYAYYADYDWVAFCWIFGKMIDLPKGFPMYCNDLKQTLDEKAKNLSLDELNKINYPNCKHDVYEHLRKTNGLSLESRIDTLKKFPDYPKQTNEHNALADAKWNYELYKFLNNL